MKLKRSPDLYAFLSNAIANADQDADQLTAETFAQASPERAAKVAAQAAALAAEFDEECMSELGSEANRWFGDEDEAKAWLLKLAASLSGSHSGSGAVELIVKDSNGAVLAEGDSVSVIKDLKVKGGSSDLKRGTLIKKIHLLADDADVVECRVDGSTLVLKTCFLKKA